MRKKFESMFKNGCQFWSSEDGNEGELVIMRRPDFREVIAREFDYLLRKISTPLRDMPTREAFVYREWVGHEFYDSTRRTGMVWRICDGPTECPVMVIDPYGANP
jgi:hypothetical protein